MSNCSGTGKTCNSDCGNCEKDRMNYEYLDDPAIIRKLTHTSGHGISFVNFSIPGISCASCVKVLERLNLDHSGILSSKVDFLKKQISIQYDVKKISLKNIVRILHDTGYEPVIDNSSDVKTSVVSNNPLRKLYIKIGVSGFCLANIMLFSFPEYLSGGVSFEPYLKNFFNYLNVLLSLPVFFYCSSDYFISAWNGLKNKIISIDLPISIGITALFVRSLYEILFFGNAGFMDSMAGLVFFLLLGKLFRNKTFETLNFERDYRSYFPISVIIKKGGIEKSTAVTSLKQGDRMVIRNNEIVPVDAILFAGESNVDYSFVTGESVPVKKYPGEIIYAGGRHLGNAIELEVIRVISRSYLTGLWNHDIFKKKSGNELSAVTDNFSKYFTLSVLLIAAASAIYWFPSDPSKAWDAFTTVLIVACPCALALTTPFALGNAQRIFGRNKFYLKNSTVTEKLAAANAIVFDKTGTITKPDESSVIFKGGSLTLRESALVKSLVRNSTHPLSRKIYDSITAVEYSAVEEFRESISEGLSCSIEGSSVRLGSMRFLISDPESCALNNYIREVRRNVFSTSVFLSINDSIKGYFSFSNKYRDGLESLIDELNRDYSVSLISGDNSFERQNLEKFFKDKDLLKFNQSPSDKLNYIKHLQKEGKNVIMIGDGLNDAGALKQSDTGITITENTSNFSPACDAILDASSFTGLSKMLSFSKTTMNVIKISFGISFLYNVIGLYLASQAIFSPMIAAILMPFNSISIVLFVIGMTNHLAKKRGLL